MLHLIRSSTKRQLLSTIGELHDRSVSEKNRAITAEHRIQQTLQLLDELDIPQNHALRAVLTGEPHNGEPALAPVLPLPFTFRDAYSSAPRLLDEAAAVTRLQALVGDAGNTPDELREYLLRYAALADRQAEKTGDQHDIEEAERTAEQLLGHDRQHDVTAGLYGHDHPVWTHHGGRGYVRQEYATWYPDRLS
ncbi:hypothetical protein [Streptomyces sp. NPDC053048]|uniref:hypothetical protein n=1 Tax=Streptomyces sp. NPDC053048 TaxID=3365694 RepID=UPI0037D6E0A4